MLVNAKRRLHAFTYVQDCSSLKYVLIFSFSFLYQSSVISTCSVQLKYTLCMRVSAVQCRVFASLSDLPQIVYYFCIQLCTSVVCVPLLLLYLFKAWLNLFVFFIQVLTLFSRDMLKFFSIVSKWSLYHYVLCNFTYKTWKVNYIVCSKQQILDSSNHFLQHKTAGLH